MPSTVILGTARTPFGKMGGALVLPGRHRARRDGDRRRPRALRGRPRAGRAGDLRPGAAGRPGPDPVAPGADQGRDPARRSRRRRSTRSAPPACARSGSPTRRSAPATSSVAVAGGMESMSGAPYLLPRRALRLSDGRRAGDRRDDPRRAHQPVHRQADDRRGERGRRRARDHPRRHGPLGRALAPARRQGDRRGAAGRGDRRRDGEAARRRRRWSRPTRRSVPRRPSRSLAKLPAIGRRRTPPTPPATRPASTTAPARWCVASDEWARARGPRRRSPGSSPTAPSPTTSPTSRGRPAKAAKQALEKIGKTPDDVDLWEINEAFASVALNSVRMLGVDEDKVNVNGGAIALGHPIGASGARIVGALVHELRRRGGGLGCAAICSGGGQGDAIVLEVNGS